MFWFQSNTITTNTTSGVWRLVEKLMLSWDSEHEIRSRFVFELVIWPQEVTSARWTQPVVTLAMFLKEAVSAKARQGETLQIPPWKGHPGRWWSNLVEEHLAAPDVFFSCGQELCWSKPTIESLNFYWFGQHSWRWFVVLATKLCAITRTSLKSGHSIAGKQGKQACNLIYQGVAVDEQFPSFHLNTFFTNIHWDIDLVQF